MKHSGGWFEQLRLERAAQEAEKSLADALQAQLAKASRLAKEEQEAAKLKRCVLLTPFDWNEGASRAQAKMNSALEAQFLDVFRSSKDGVASEGLNKLWLQVALLCTSQPMHILTLLLSSITTATVSSASRNCAAGLKKGSAACHPLRVRASCRAGFPCYLLLR